MKIWLILSSLVCFCIMHFSQAAARRKTSASPFKQRLVAARQATETAINDIFAQWEIETYPNFLKTVWMHKTSWELLRLRFEHKMLLAEVHEPQNFVASFLGSSVTAGHDSFFKESYPVLVGEILAPVFEKVQVNFISRNVAMGNNPCMPYDVCVNTFAGTDADIVHWEQSYNCGFGDSLWIIEQFVRQAMQSPSQPIIVFSDSSTKNWHESDCPADTSSPYTPDTADKALLHAAKANHGLMTVATETNHNEMGKWGYIHRILHQYKNSGFQLYTHDYHEKYKCRGPYISTWGNGAASWHASVSGHRLRAAHYSLYWLAIFRDGLDHLIDSVDIATPKELLQNIEAHLKPIYASQATELSTRLIPSLVPDHAVCYTDYEPRSERDNSLQLLIIAGVVSSTEENAKGWKTSIYEALIDKNIINKSRTRGYLDYKIVTYGNKNMGPLSLKISPKQIGHLFLCEAPGIWGKMIDGFDHLWESNAEIYLTENVGAVGSNFVVNTRTAKKLEFTHEKRDELCMKSVETLRVGTHVVTITPTSDKNIMLATVILP